MEYKAGLTEQEAHRRTQRVRRPYLKPTVCTEAAGANAAGVSGKAVGYIPKDLSVCQSWLRYSEGCREVRREVSRGYSDTGGNRSEGLNWKQTMEIVSLTAVAKPKESWKTARLSRTASSERERTA